MAPGVSGELCNVKGPHRPIPVVIDTDPGVDDALALALAFASPELTVRAVTTVAGNVDLETATANAVYLLDLLAPDHAPRLAKGCALSRWRARL